MPQITVITGGPTGALQTETVEIETVPLQLRVIDHKGNLVRMSPAAVRGIDLENDADVERVTDQCGRTEEARQTDKNWEVTLDCVITAESYRTEESGRLVENLTLRRAKQLKFANSIELEGDIFEGISGSFEVDNVFISQSNDLVSVNVGGDDMTAYELQLQLKQSEPGDL